MADYGGGFVGVAMLGPGISSFDDFAISSSPISTLTSTPTTVPPTIPALVEEKSHDFSPENIQWDLILNDPRGTVQYEDGKYSFDTNIRVFFLGMWEKERNIGLNNFAVEVMALGPWGDKGALEQGLVIGWQDEDFSRPAYAFTLSSSGTCRFWSRVPNEENWVSKPTNWRPESRLSITEEELNESAQKLLLVKKDNILTGYVDGQVCGQFEMDDYQRGYIGLATLSPDMGGKSFFDDFRLYRLKDDELDG
jgi:hypothetical protein